MIKFILTSLFLLSFSPKGYSQAPKGYSQAPKDASTFEFNVRMVKMSRNRELKIHRAISILRDVIASDEFKSRILHHRFRGRKAFVNSRGLSNSQIYHKILLGAERLHPYKNNAMDLHVELYTDNSSNVVGYTYPRSFKVWMNTKFFNRNGPEKVAANLMHEWLHKLGFDHDAEKTNNRKYSVPYGVGKIISELARRRQ